MSAIEIWISPPKFQCRTLTQAYVGKEAAFCLPDSFLKTHHGGCVVTSHRETWCIQRHYLTANVSRYLNKDH